MRCSSEWPRCGRMDLYWICVVEDSTVGVCSGVSHLSSGEYAGVQAQVIDATKAERSSSQRSYERHKRKEMRAVCCARIDGFRGVHSLKFYGEKMDICMSLDSFSLVPVVLISSNCAAMQDAFTKQQREISSWNLFIAKE